MTHIGVLRAALLSVVATCGIGMLSAVHAGKPAPPPPPPTPPDPTTIYEWREDLGGWLDTQRNLVWGYSLSQVTGSSYTYSSSLTSAAASYPSKLALAATDYDLRGDNMLAAADDYQDLADAAYAAGDTTLGDEYQYQADRRYVRADEYYDSADICGVAAVNAAQFSNWRLPTKDEAVDASWKGLFSYGATGFNEWDASPYVGFQSNFANNLYWTSTAVGTNGKYQWSFVPATGATSQSTKTSVMWAIVVRTHTP